MLPPDPQASAKQLERVQALAQIGTWTLDLASNRLLWSAETHRIFGEPLGGIVAGSDFVRAVHPEDQAKVEATWQELRETGHAVLECRLLRDDQVIWLHGRAELELDAQGRPVRAFGVVQDLTSRRRFEAELRERFAFEQVVSRISSRFVGFIQFDTAVNDSLADLGRFTGADRVHLFQFSTDGRYFHNTHEWCAPEVSSAMDASQNLDAAQFDWWVKALAQGEQIRLADVAEFPPEAAAERAICASQDIRALLVQPLFVGQILAGYLGLENLHNPRVWTDVQSRALTMVTEIMGSALERERLAAQLQQAQKLESVGVLAGGVAHEFNNLLSVIIGHTELGLLGLDQAHPVHGNLQRIQEAADRCAALTKRLLSFARMQANKPERLDLNAVLEARLPLLQGTLGADIQLRWQPGKGPFHVYMDATQLHQILTNLALNARDALQGKGSVLLETRRLRAADAQTAQLPGDAANQYVALVFADDGPGMESAVQARMFEPFFTTKAPGQGPGLGLPTVYGLVQQSKGYIRVNSHPGAGTSLLICLPLLPEPQDQLH